jgi:NAD(P)H-hydrate epimerase
MIVTPEEMRELENKVIQEDGVSSISLMENAGKACADFFIKEVAGKLTTPFLSATGKNGVPEERILVLCGKGNNAGDGMVIARELHRYGIFVHTVLCMDHPFTKDTETEYQRLVDTKATLFSLQDTEWKEETYTAVFDALLGTGAGKPLSPELLTLIAQINKRPGIKIAVDVPTGIHPGNGSFLSENAFRADITLTFEYAKTGLWLSPGRFFSGRIHVLPIGVSENQKIPLHRERSAISEPVVKTCVPIRIPWGHKGMFGKVGVLGGSAFYRGAPVLSSKAALAAGCGLVFCFYPSLKQGESGYHFDPEIIGRQLPSENGCHSIRYIDFVLQEMQQLDTLLIGPGLGRNIETLELVRKLLPLLKIPVVLDADGLYAFRGHPELLKNRANIPLILTPHAMEFAQLLNRPLDVISDNWVAEAEAFAEKVRGILVLKGATTLIALPEKKSYFNVTGNSGLSVGGSGDVLAGLIAGFLPSTIHCPENAAIIASYILGKTAEYYAEEKWEGSFTPSKAIEIIPEVVKRIEVAN